MGSLKPISSLIGLAIAASILPQSAQAATLQISIGSNSPIVDNGSGDTNSTAGIITFKQTFSNFSIQGTAQARQTLSLTKTTTTGTQIGGIILNLTSLTLTNLTSSPLTVPTISFSNTFSSFSSSSASGYLLLTGSFNSTAAASSGNTTNFSGVVNGTQAFFQPVSVAGTANTALSNFSQSTITSLTNVSGPTLTGSLAPTLAANSTLSLPSSACLVVADIPATTYWPDDDDKEDDKEHDDEKHHKDGDEKNHKDGGEKNHKDNEKDTNSKTFSKHSAQPIEFTAADAESNCHGGRSVPETSPLVGLLALGVLGVGTALHRHHALKS